MARSLQKANFKRRIFVLDQEPVVRRGLELLLSRQFDLEICGSAGTAERALAKILMLKPDLAVVDLGLRSASRLKLIRRLRKYCPEVKILVFSMEDKLSFVRLALHAGAHGFVPKQEGSEKILEEIRRLLGGQSAGAGQFSRKCETQRLSPHPR
jgi:DNA-binding NarL/FixJ family response regulator